jgi:hypothetical protein
MDRAMMENRMRLLVLIMATLWASSSGAFSYATGGCASGGCSNTSSEQWLSTNADEVDAALDVRELSAAQRRYDLSGNDDDGWDFVDRCRNWNVDHPDWRNASGDRDALF